MMNYTKSSSFSNRMKSLLMMLVIMSVSSVFTANAVAADKEKGKGKSKTKVTVAMSQKVYESLQKAQDLLNTKDYVGALAAVEKIRAGKKGKKLSSYEVAQTWNLQAYLYYLQEQYPESIHAYENVIKQADLPEALTQSSLKTISQLYFTTEEYGKALETVKRLIATLEEPAADVYMLMGQAYFQMEDYKSALTPIQKAITMYKTQGNKPKENWLLLLRVIYHKMEDYPKMLNTLEELLALYPKDQYLKTMAGVYSELGNTQKQLTIMESLYEKGLVERSSQIVNIANLYMMHGVPIKAAEMLDKEINNTKRVEGKSRNYRLLSQAWYMAREDEKSIPPMAKAAKMSQEGELFLRLAQSHLNLDHYDDAAKAIYKALELGGLKRSDTANIMLGMALFNQVKLKGARKAFVNASKDKRSRKVAQQWIAYVDSELERAKALDL